MKQAQSLKELRAHLWKEGLRGIHYLIVNDNSSASLARYERLKAQVPPAIPVLQHAPNDTDVWSTLSGTKDDFFIYDRCGRLVAKVGLPLSILAFPYVEEAVRRAYFTPDVCGPCNKTMKYNTTVNGSAPWEEDLEAAQNGKAAEVPTAAPLPLGGTRVLLLPNLQGQRSNSKQQQQHGQHHHHVPDEEPDPDKSILD